VSGGVQLRIGAELPIDPESAAKLTTPERGALYNELELDFEQRQAVETAVRLVIAKRYGRGRRGA
jgi:hypothetical protein